MSKKKRIIKRLKKKLKETRREVFQLYEEKIIMLCILKKNGLLSEFFDGDIDDDLPFR